VDSTAQNPTFMYDTPGTYSVELVVTNNAGSDTLTRADYIAVGEAPIAPMLEVSTTAINVSTPVGTNANPASFTVRNSNTGTLNYMVRLLPQAVASITQFEMINALLGEGIVTPAYDLNSDSVINVADLITLLDPDNLPDWLSVSPDSGDSTGEPDTINVTFDAAGLALGEYNATIEVSANADNSPQNVAVTLTVTEALPTDTSVVPDPPIAGQEVRVWYIATGGPLQDQSPVTLHWGVNGGLVQGGTWEMVTDTAMTQSSDANIWFADITVPAGATSLNFVTNVNATVWDNNSNQDWNFAVNP
jgi:PKD repeat protein